MSHKLLVLIYKNKAKFKLILNFSNIYLNYIRTQFWLKITFKLLLKHNKYSNCDQRLFS